MVYLYLRSFRLSVDPFVVSYMLDMAEQTERVLCEALYGVIIWG